MENGDYNFFSNNNGGSSTNPTHPAAWDFWQLGTTSTTSHSQLFEWNNSNTNTSLLTQELMFGRQQQPAAQTFTDHRLMCLNLNLGGTKRQFFETHHYQPHDEGAGLEFVMNKRRKPYFSAGCGDGDGDGVGLLGPSTAPAGTIPAASVPPRCQVDGCQLALVNAKAYHRRHKVCEKHAKAPKVVILGLEQRFCQQCSRFHSLSEFDESKRSCRRRLAGHNERRRKTSQEVHFANMTRNSFQGNYAVNEGRAFSLLSSKNDWYNRHQHHPMKNPMSIHPKTSTSVHHHNRNHMVLESNTNNNNNAPGYLTTLDFMHVRNSELGFMSRQQEEHQPKEEEGRQEHWNSFLGPHHLA